MKIQQAEGKLLQWKQSSKWQTVQGVYIVSDGIREGDEIIAEGASLIRSGTPVRPEVSPYDNVTAPVAAVLI